MSTEAPHPASPYRPSQTTCTACGTPLWREACGCWTDCLTKRWCDTGSTLHRPEAGLQPKTCRGTL